MWTPSLPLTPSSSSSAPWSSQPELGRRVPGKGKEPGRSKSHWDYVLDEMAWLAKDFEKERKWKLSQAKKVAVKVSKSKLDNATRGQKRQKGEEQRIRRMASNIAKDVKKFWAKIEKLVIYKHQLEVEEWKKKALDKHLNFLVGQTERYSTMLAEILTDVPVSRLESQLLLQPSPSAFGSDSRTDISLIEEHLEIERSPSPITDSEVIRTEESKEMKGDVGNIEEPDEMTDDAGTSEELLEINSDSEILTKKGREDEDVDFHLEDEEDMDDDEATLEADEALITEDERREELLALEKESSLPLEELLKQYQAGVDDEEVEQVNAGEDNIADAAAAAQSAQPTGFTFSTTKVRSKLPFLLKHSLREYQHIGLDWLVTMYEKRLNGILADEMGLGKTIMTIALLAHLACEKGIWGPHLIVVPTSVMLNWETEFMKWCPAFKVLTYFGSAKERKVKRQGWSKPNYFHVCITTYRLVIQDAKAFKRKKWKYLILDEAHLIKNWKSQRWQTLLNFNSKRRILLTGTPLQNDLMELWSLMHFLMPHVFQSHQEFRDWFNNPITGMVEGQEQINKELVDRLHNVLRPFLLRRLKQDVEKQLPKKYEHVIRCRLSKRQRNLYEDFMARSDTQATLAGGNFLGLINVLMQLRKVCNHPDLFEGRPIISSFDMQGVDAHLSRAVCSIFEGEPFSMVSLSDLNLVFSHFEFDMSSLEADELTRIATPASLIEVLGCSREDNWNKRSQIPALKGSVESLIEEVQAVLRDEKVKQKQERAAALAWLNMLRCSRKPLYGYNLRNLLTVEHPVHDIHKIKADPSRYLEVSSTVSDLVLLPSTRFERLMELLQAFVFAIPAARAPSPEAWCSHPASASILSHPAFSEGSKQEISTQLAFLRPIIVRRQLFFPDRRLLQFDCGKLQEMAVLLRQLKSDGHRALIFTQMTKMLDVLENFVNLHGYTYLRLDGSTKPEDRQILMQRFNTNPKLFLFLLSTRSGGVGVNLVGADTVIFYDSDWNPAMDQQAQDRCHRIGQTREVHIYRLISESTVEENILKKANQKRALDDLVIQSGSYNTDFFKKLDPMELLSGLKGVKAGSSDKGVSPEPATSGHSRIDEISSSEVEAALKNAEDEADYMALKKVEQEEAAENQEFTEEGFLYNMDDDECADDLEDGKTNSEKRLQMDGILISLSKPEGEDHGVEVFKEVAAVPADLDEDMDMLADVKQMAAAAAAAGRGSASFDDQLQPIERYAMRFLELWDPVIDRTAIENQVVFEETEWELDRLEKLKEEHEAEIDEDNEPLFYESWDTSFADEAYHQQVEVLAQQQEYLRQLECEAAEDDAEFAEGAEKEVATSAKLRKLKKAKFKSLKKGSLATRDESLFDKVSLQRSLKAKDADWTGPDSLVFRLPYRGPSQRKRKVPKLLEEEMLIGIHRKKLKNDQANREQGNLDKGTNTSAWEACDFGSDSVVMLLDPAMPVYDSMKKSNFSRKISIVGPSLKKGPLITLQKERKRDGVRCQEYIPPADPWVPAEDAILCAIVHEYGGNWDLVSETLAGTPDGGVYRGRFRHPIHCRERFRQLLTQNTSIAASGDPHGGPNVANAQFKVTEVHVKQLLQAVQQMADDELLLQHHFVAILNSVGLCEGIQTRNQKMPALSKHSGSPHGPPFIPLPKITSNIGSTITPNKFADSHLVAAALAQPESHEMRVTEVAGYPNQGDTIPKSSKSKTRVEGCSSEKDHLEISLELIDTSDDHTLPQSITVSIYDLELLKNSQRRSNSVPANSLCCFSRGLSEHRYRMASKMGCEGEVYQWAASAGTGLGIVVIPSMRKVQMSGKRRLTSELGKTSESKQARPSKKSKKNKLSEAITEVESCQIGDGGENSGHCSSEATCIALANVLPEKIFSVNASSSLSSVGLPLPVYPLNVSNISVESPVKESALKAPAEILNCTMDTHSQMSVVDDLTAPCFAEERSQVSNVPSFLGVTKTAQSNPSGDPVKSTLRDFDLNDESSSDDVIAGLSSIAIPSSLMANMAGAPCTSQFSHGSRIDERNDNVCSRQTNNGHQCSELLVSNQLKRVRWMDRLPSSLNNATTPLPAGEGNDGIVCRQGQSSTASSSGEGNCSIVSCSIAVSPVEVSQTMVCSISHSSQELAKRLTSSAALLPTETSVLVSSALSSSWASSFPSVLNLASECSKRAAVDTSKEVIFRENIQDAAYLGLTTGEADRDCFQQSWDLSEFEMTRNAVGVDFEVASQSQSSPDKRQSEIPVLESQTGIRFTTGEHPSTRNFASAGNARSMLPQFLQHQLPINLSQFPVPHSSAVTSSFFRPIVSSNNALSPSHSLNHQLPLNYSLHHFRYPNQASSGPNLGLTLGPTSQIKPSMNLNHSPSSPPSP